jgi:pimeloyl-ACP methyl ester carboxylesterase
MTDQGLPSPTNGIVFIHGVRGSARAWQPQGESFRAAGYTPLALDLPGYGGQPAIETIDFEQFSKDVEAQIAASGLIRPVLVGHSLGGMIAQTMLRRKPDGYQAVVLVGTSPAFGRPDGDFQQTFVADRLAPLRAGTRHPRDPRRGRGDRPARPELARFKIPREVVFVESPPRTALGKVRHFMLRERE